MAEFDFLDDGYMSPPRADALPVTPAGEQTDMFYRLSTASGSSYRKYDCLIT